MLLNFKVYPANTPISINPAHIGFVKPADDNDNVTLIHLAAPHTNVIPVSGKFTDVANQIGKSN
jgi:hypothetical protein